MLRRLTVLALFTSLLAAGIPPASASSERVGRYVVVLHRSVGDPAKVANQHARDHGAQVGHVYRYAIKGYSAAIPDSRVAAIRADSRVAAVNVDASVSASTHGVPNAPTGVRRTYAAANSAIGIDGHDDKRVDVDIAIIDTGIDVDHPDLNVVGGKNCQKGTSYDDGNGHGTHVAGTAAGLDNGNGAVGMAPGARLWAVRVLDNSGSGSWSSVICGVDWVTGINSNQNADETLNTSDDIEVANMSLGGSGSEPSASGCSTGSGLHDAICKSVAAGTTYAVAAGNSAADSKDHVPAAYDEVITVSALADFNGEPGGGATYTCRSDLDDTFANFSNYGADVDAIAPGVCIRSAWKGGSYNTISGTSMASPHVAGAAALYKSSNPSASPSTVKTALVSNGNKVWIWPSEDNKDGVQEPLLDVSNSTFAPVWVGTGGTTPPANTAPVAQDDSATTAYETPVTVSVLANDSDVDAGTVLEVKASNLTQPQAGTGEVVLNADQTVTYTPPTGYSGLASFNYTAYDGSLDSNVATVSITVQAATSSPPADATLAVDVAASQSTKKGPWHHVSLTVTVTAGTAAVSGATVALDVLDGACPGTGTPSSGSGTTDSSGTVTFTFKTRSQANYCATATATKDGYTNGAGSTTFTT